MRGRERDGVGEREVERYGGTNGKRESERKGLMDEGDEAESRAPRNSLKCNSA